MPGFLHLENDFKSSSTGNSLFNGWDSELPMHGAQVRSLVGELDLDLVCHS